jgi:hypothetical protein
MSLSSPSIAAALGGDGGARRGVEVLDDGLTVGSGPDDHAARSGPWRRVQPDRAGMIVGSGRRRSHLTPDDHFRRSPGRPDGLAPSAQEGARHHHALHLSSWSAPPPSGAHNARLVLRL